MDYEHTQQGKMYLFTVGVMALVLLAFVVLAREDSPVLMLVVIAVVAITIAVTFSRLRATVDATTVTVAFGPGWPRRRIPLAEITSVTPVRNRWYHGWGIRLVSNGWMFNVWGLDAVELGLASGRVFRIGTDEPSELAAAIEARRPA